MAENNDHLPFEYLTSPTMTKPTQTTDDSKKKLGITLTIGIVAASLLLVLEILPAQYGIDLTGFGTYIGLTKIYEQKMSLLAHRNTVPREDTVNIQVPEGEDLEFKFFLLEGDRFDYSWIADQGELFFDFHGEPVRGSGHLKSYDLSTASHSEGSLVAPFEGTHGWYWRNDSDAPITVTLNVQGKYSLIGKKAAAFRR